MTALLISFLVQHLGAQRERYLPNEQSSKREVNPWAEKGRGQKKVVVFTSFSTPSGAKRLLQPKCFSERSPAAAINHQSLGEDFPRFKTSQPKPNALLKTRPSSATRSGLDEGAAAVLLCPVPDVAVLWEQGHEGIPDNPAQQQEGRRQLELSWAVPRERASEKPQGLHRNGSKNASVASCKRNQSRLEE